MEEKNEYSGSIRGMMSTRFALLHAPVAAKHVDRIFVSQLPTTAARARFGRGQKCEVPQVHDHSDRARNFGGSFATRAAAASRF